MGEGKIAPGNIGNKKNSPVSGPYFMIYPCRRKPAGGSSQKISRGDTIGGVTERNFLHDVGIYKHGVICPEKQSNPLLNHLLYRRVCRRTGDSHQEVRPRAENNRNPGICNPSHLVPRGMGTMDEEIGITGESIINIGTIAFTSMKSNDLAGFLHPVNNIGIRTDIPGAADPCSLCDLFTSVPSQDDRAAGEI